VSGRLRARGEIAGVGVPGGMGRDLGYRGTHRHGEGSGVPGCLWVGGEMGVLGYPWAWGETRGVGVPTGVGRDWGCWGAHGCGEMRGFGVPMGAGGEGNPTNMGK